ncbi:hypothetical protein BCh11DRAFT_07266 [Burkholderia sp. Ch1-1]|nr:hypothetical protein BCh11DRAFT_07266 [Burkholderia sp. Ch1-1]
MRITHLGTGFPAQWERLQIEQPVSLAAALVVIAISSLAFWWNQPDGLFDGGEPSCAAVSAAASASGKPGGQNGPLFTRGLLSLEVSSAIIRTSPRSQTSSQLPADDHSLEAPRVPISCSPATRIGR